MRPLAAMTVLVLSAVILRPVAARAQQCPPCLPEKVGEWQQTLSLKPLQEDTRLSPAEAARFARKLTAFADILHAASVFQPPRGIMPRLKAYFTSRQEGDTGRVYRQPVQGREHVALFFFLKDRTGQAVWGGENATIADFYVNDPQMAMGVEYDLVYEGLPLPDGRRIRFAPAKTAEVGGYPVYDEKYVVITRSPRPVWIPVTREQYLSALIRVRQEQVDSAQAQQRDPYQVWLSERQKREQTRDEVYAALKKTSAAQAEQFLKSQADIEARTETEMKKLSAQQDPGPLRAMRAGVAALREELARMPAGERQSQAWLQKMGDAGTSSLLPAGTAGARPLVVINWDFLDRSRPRADWQIVVGVFEPGIIRNLHEHPGFVRLKQFRETTEWGKVAALLD